MSVPYSSGTLSLMCAVRTIADGACPEMLGGTSLRSCCGDPLFEYGMYLLVTVYGCTVVLTSLNLATLETQHVSLEGQGTLDVERPEHASQLAGLSPVAAYHRRIIKT